MKWSVQKLNQQGAASMMSVAIFAIIVTVVVTAYLRSAISQQAQANNYDFSTRAYYAAESGIQDAIRAINENPAINTQDSCNDFVPQQSANGGLLSSSLGIKYTCQLINKTPENITFHVREDQNAMIRLQPLPPPAGNYEVVLRWSKRDTSGLVARQEESTHFPAQSAWLDGDNRTIHPAMRVALVTHAAQDGAANIQQRVVFLNPLDQSTTLSGQGFLALSSADTADQAQEKLVQHARCYSADDNQDYSGYLCEQVITMAGYPLNSNVLFARLHSLYGSTDAQLSIRVDDQTLPLTGSVVEIDVTGNAGTTFRRVRQTYNLQNGVMFDTIPEAAVVGGDGICKYYSITDNPNEFANSGNCFIP